MYHYLLKKSGDGHFDFEKTDIISRILFNNQVWTYETSYQMSLLVLAYTVLLIRTGGVKKNVPVLKKQPYIESTVDNYVSKSII